MTRLISHKDPLLAARIPLPPNPVVVYTVYQPSPDNTDPYDAVELARRAVLNDAPDIVGSVLPSVQSGTEPRLFLFVIASQHTHHQTVPHFTFERLSILEQSSFRIQDTSGTALPHVYSRFLDAVRSRTIVNIVNATTSSDLATTSHVRRFKDGFVIHRNPPISDWALGWEHKLSHRPIVYFYIQVQVAYFSGDSPSHLLIHPSPIPTPFTTLSLKHSLCPGAPIFLLPYGTPAYFLAPYNGPSNALTKLFDESLQGLGAGRWVFDEQSPRFVIGWIRVENKQGEDKGTPFIWPTRLCLSYLPSQSVEPLDPLPELPALLQPSPQISIPDSSALNNTVSPSAISRSLPLTLRSYPPRLNETSVKAFRSLTANSKGINQLADEVGSYVDVVARDRERERERLKKERESGHSPKLSRTAVVAPGNVPLPATTGMSPATVSHLPVPPALAATQQTLADQVFYPSPPSQNPPVVDLQMTIPTKIHQTPVPAITPHPPPTPASPPNNNGEVTQRGFDLFSNGSNWSQPTDPYMNLDMGFGMEVDLNFNVNPSNDEPTNNFTTRGNAQDEDFTEDDFSFFDSKPTRNPVLHSPLHDQTHFISPKTTPNKPSLATPSINVGRALEGMHLSGPGPPSALQTPWTPGDIFTPRSAVEGADFHPPDLIPSSPAPSPEPVPAPRTPTVQLDLDFDIQRKLTNDHSSSLFDPIPFSPYYRTVDNKYSSGKFSMSAPISECSLSFSPLSADEGQTWRRRYDSVTDPRPGVIRKLIGFKRKLPDAVYVRPRSSTFSASASASASWFHQSHEDWTSTSPSSPSAMDIDNDEDAQSEIDSDEENQLESGTESPIMSRPATPPPSYLPPGPSLLHHNFLHSLLLPISTPSRPPGSSPSPCRNPDEPSHPIPSVPTPVSPAAMLGAVSEKSKFLQDAAIAIALETVHNPLWATTWHATNNTRRVWGVWPDDVKAAAELLHCTRGVEGPLDLTKVYNFDSTSDPLQVLEQPHISVGKSNAIIQTLPSALHFWDKLGLSPRAGHKDFDVYVVYEEGDENDHARIDEWVTTVGSIYEAKHMGEVTRGKSTAAIDGILPIHFDTNFRKSISTLVSSLEGIMTPIVIFVIVPVSIMTLSSSILRQALASMKKAIQGLDGNQVIFHLIPHPYILDTEESPRAPGVLETLCLSVYDRIHVAVYRHMASNLYIPGTSDQLFQEFAFTLSRPLVHKVTYSRSAHASPGVLDRFTLLHVAYKLSPCEKWIVAACTDQRGEAYALGLWYIPSHDENEEGEIDQEVFVAQKVLQLVLGVAQKARIEWRIVISKLGLISPIEMEAWRDQIKTALNFAEPMHIFLVSTESDAPWTVINPRPFTVAPPTKTHPKFSSLSSKQGVLYTDASSVVYAIHPISLVSMSTPPPPITSLFSNYQIPEPSPPLSDSQQAQSTPSDAVPNAHKPQDLLHPLPSMPYSTTALISVSSLSSSPSISTLHIHLMQSFHSPPPSSAVPDDTLTHLDITHNFFELAVLASARRLTTTASTSYNTSGFNHARSSNGNGTGAGNSNTNNGLLPFHFAAIEAMWSCLDVDWEILDRPTNE